MLSKNQHYVEKQTGKRRNNYNDKHHSECKVWRCGSEVIPVRFMSDHHIINTIKRIQNSTETHFVGQLRQDWLATLFAEKKLRERFTATVMKNFRSIEHLVD